MLFVPQNFPSELNYELLQTQIKIFGEKNHQYWILCIFSLCNIKSILLKHQVKATELRNTVFIFYLSIYIFLIYFYLWFIMFFPQAFHSELYRAFQKKRLNSYFAYPISLSFEPRIFKILVSTPHNYRG